MYINKTERREALQRLRKAARKAGLECLDSEWRNMKTRYRFRCAQGHEYLCFPESVLDCPECRDSQQLARIYAAVAQLGGQCLETHYLGSKARYRFVCAAGHRWTATAGGLLQRGHWCKRCSAAQNKLRQRHKDGLERLQAAARDKGGECLDTTYRGVDVRYSFRCAQGHEWKSFGAGILSGRWCRQCKTIERAKHQSLADGLERLQSAARAKGGECLSQTYVNLTTRYHLRCTEGHEWHAAAANIFAGCWCPKCFRQARRDSIETMQEMAQARGGRCISTTYTGCQDKLAWECRRGHIWITASAVVKSGAWCPACAQMDRTRDPDPNGLARLQAAARAKDGECLSLTYTGGDARYHMRCKNGHEWHPSGRAVFQGHWCPQCVHQARRDTIESMRKIAQERGGNCLSEEYANDGTNKLTWECRRGHVWQSIPNSIKKGQWCPHCKRSEIFEEAQQAAQAHGGHCISQEYVHSETRMGWKCHLGHTWRATAYEIRAGEWCPHCKKITKHGDKIGVLHKIAQARGGACLSTIYPEGRGKLTWECHCGHVWQAAAAPIKRGHWCPTCAHMNKTTNPKTLLKYLKRG